LSSKYHREVKKILKKLFPHHQIKEEVSMKINGVTKNKDAGKLHVDLFVKGLNIAIEVDGEHHYEAIDYGDGQGQVNFERRRYLDNLKDDIAYENGWTMVRIPFDKAKDEKWIMDAIDKAVEEYSYNT